jgi:hypothetical protein
MQISALTLPSPFEVAAASQEWKDSRRPEVCSYVRVQTVAIKVAAAWALGKLPALS